MLRAATEEAESLACENWRLLSRASSARGILLRITRETRTLVPRGPDGSQISKSVFQQRTGENSALKSSVVRYNNKTKSCRVCPPLAPKAGVIEPFK